MNPLIRQIAQRMSLREPLAASLEILSRVADLILRHEEPPEKSLQLIREQFPQVTEFERNFPNLCFGIATGVGKTRLVGAMIAYLAETKGIKNFVIIAPNTTITEKLVREFTHPSDPKYVFKGLPAFANRFPQIVTGETFYERTGLFPRSNQESFNPESVTINIFNIALLHLDNGRFRRSGYFDDLRRQQDLVIFMDEAHRYRAEAAFDTINDLKPTLGIELTATPQIQIGKCHKPFKNVIYRYTFKDAHAAGYVKRVGLNERSNINYDTYQEEELERLKLQDGLSFHRNVQIYLDDYIQRKKTKRVKPIMLVIVKDTNHAERIQTFLESQEFHEGQYRGKVLTVHSNQGKEEKEETIRALLEVESPVNPFEIVIHVTMLKEGWDVANLYTIVPLRKGDSRTLVEQSIGRAARLPFGQRTGIDAIDFMYIVAHEHFDKIKKELKDEDFPPPQPLPVPKPVKTVDVPPILPSTYVNPPAVTPDQEQPMPGLSGGPKVSYPESTSSSFIPVPRLILVPDPNTVPGKFLNFELNVEGFLPRPTDSSISIVDPFDGTTHKFHPRLPSVFQGSFEERIASALFDCNDVAEANDDDPEQQQLVSQLAGQMILHLRSYLNDDDKIALLLSQYLDAIAHFIHQQMLKHYRPGEEKLIYSYGQGFLPFKNASYVVTKETEPFPFNESKLPEGARIESLLWNGFKKSIYPIIRFHSNSERLFSSCLESDDDVLQWVKPPRDTLPIAYQKDGTNYEPDFVIETKTERFLCEVKDRRFLTDPLVEFKRQAAIEWCAAATGYSDKPWSYLLIPHDEIDRSFTFSRYCNHFRQGR
jgi:type III restriction enzyme